MIFTEYRLTCFTFYDEASGLADDNFEAEIQDEPTSQVKIQDRPTSDVLGNDIAGAYNQIGPSSGESFNANDVASDDMDDGVESEFQAGDMDGNDKTKVQEKLATCANHLGRFGFRLL